MRHLPVDECRRPRHATAADGAGTSLVQLLPSTQSLVIRVSPGLGVRPRRGSMMLGYDTTLNSAVLTVLSMLQQQ